MEFQNIISDDINVSSPKYFMKANQNLIPNRGSDESNWIKIKIKGAVSCDGMRNIFHSQILTDVNFFAFSV